MISSVLTHFDAQGQAHMVDVAAKAATHRIAVAQGTIVMRRATQAMILQGNAQKGDVLGIARLAGIMAAKKTSELIPLCHPLALSKVALDFSADDFKEGDGRVEALNAPEWGQLICTATAETVGPTGVEMEALTAVNMALLTIYDMCKAIDRGMVMNNIRLLEKHGGQSGSYVAVTPLEAGCR